MVDSDKEIVKEQGVSISEIVSTTGWESFRDMETRMIERLSALSNHVVAAGGGAVLRDENTEFMKKSGKVIWLKATAETIQKRMAQDQSTGAYRPALTDKGIFDEIEETLTIRDPLYQNAMDHGFDTDDRTIDDICTMILEKLDSKGN